MRAVSTPLLKNAAKTWGTRRATPAILSTANMRTTHAPQYRKDAWLICRERFSLLPSLHAGTAVLVLEESGSTDALGTFGAKEDCEEMLGKMVKAKAEAGDTTTAYRCLIGHSAQ